MCACPHSTTFRMGRWHQSLLAEGLRSTLVTGTQVLLWHKIQNWPKSPAISWWDLSSLLSGVSHTSSCCCLGVILVAALLVLLYRRELLWKSRRAQFPPEMTAINILYIQTSAFIAGGRQHDGCVWFRVRGGEEEHLQLQETWTECHPWSSKLSFTCRRKPCPGVSSWGFWQAGASTCALSHECCNAIFPQEVNPPACSGVCSSLLILPYSDLTNQITNRNKGSLLWASLWCKIYKTSALQLPYSFLSQQPLWLAHCGTRVWICTSSSREEEARIPHSPAVVFAHVYSYLSSGLCLRSTRGYTASYRTGDCYQAPKNHYPGCYWSL